MLNAERLPLFHLGLLGALAVHLLAPNQALCSSDPWTAFRERPIQSVDFVSAGSDETVVSQDSLLAVVGLVPGELVRAAPIERAIQRLYALGRFSDVRLHAERSAGEVVLHFVLTPRQWLEQITIEGTELSDAEALEKALLLRSGDDFDADTKAIIEQRAIVHLRTSGFPLAKVSVSLASSDRIHIEMLLVVNEGEPERVQKIRFEGETRVPNHLLLRELSTQVGSIADASILRADAQALQAAYVRRGFLQAKVAEPSCTPPVLTFSVAQGPRVLIRFSGNRRVSNAALERALALFGKSLATQDPELGAERIERLYRRLGYVGTRAFVQRIEPGPGLLVLLFQVREGAAVPVQKLVFDGASVFSLAYLRELVRSFLRQDLGEAEVDELTLVDPRGIGQKPKAPSEHASASRDVIPEERWVPESYARVLEQIAAAYRQKGFADVQVGPAELDAARQLVRVPIIEGERVEVRSVVYQGNDALPSAMLLEAMEQGLLGQSSLSLSAPYSAAMLEEARGILTKKYRDEGYLYARVTTQIAQEGPWADLSFRIEEGPQVRLGRVLLQGHTHTRESIMRGRMRMQTGDVYRLEQALTDQRSVATLGVFNDVAVRLLDEEDAGTVKDLVVDVRERNRQPIDLGMGFSTADGPRLRVDYAHLNLWGTATRFSANLKVNRQVFFDLYSTAGQVLKERYRRFDVGEQVEREVRVALASPRFLVLPADPSVRIDGILERDNALRYSLDALTAATAIELHPYQGLQVTLEPQISSTELSCDADLAALDCSREARAERQRRQIAEGRLTTIKLGPTLSWDDRNDVFNPQQGSLVRVSGAYAKGTAVAPGSGASTSFSFVKVEGAWNEYLQALSGVLALSLRGGWIADLAAGGIPIHENFTLGGRNSLRGYGENTLQPEDLCDIAGLSCDALPRDLLAVSAGGTVFVLAKSEWRLPLRDAFSLALFVDAGNLWTRMPSSTASLTLRLGLGAGLRFQTPIGPLALDVGVNPNPRPRFGETRIEPHFSVGVF